MRYWLLLTQAVSATGNMRASVVGPMTLSQYNQRYGGSGPGAGSPNGYATRLEAAAAAAKYNANPGAALPKAAAPSDLTGPTGDIGGVHISNPLGGINAIGDFFNRLTQPNTWIRVGEVLGGLLLVYMGLRASFSGTEAAKAANTVTKPVKKGVSTAASITPVGRGLKVEKRARQVARRRNIESAAGRRATEIRRQQRAKA